MNIYLEKFSEWKIWEQILTGFIAVFLLAIIAVVLFKLLSKVFKIGAFVLSGLIVTAAVFFVSIAILDTYIGTNIWSNLINKDKSLFNLNLVNFLTIQI